MPIAAKVPKTVATAPELKATIKLLRREFHNGAESKINFSYHTKERPVKFVSFDALNE